MKDIRWVVAVWTLGKVLKINEVKEVLYCYSTFFYGV